jgi:hypothetical protein
MGRPKAHCTARATGAVHCARADGRGLEGGAPRTRARAWGRRRRSESAAQRASARRRPPVARSWCAAPGALGRSQPNVPAREGAGGRMRRADEGMARAWHGREWIGVGRERGRWGRRQRAGLYQRRVLHEHFEQVGWQVGQALVVAPAVGYACMRRYQRAPARDATTRTCCHGECAKERVGRHSMPTRACAAMRAHESTASRRLCVPRCTGHVSRAMTAPSSGGRATLGPGGTARGHRWYSEYSEYLGGNAFRRCSASSSRISCTRSPSCSATSTYLRVAAVVPRMPSALRVPRVLGVNTMGTWDLSSIYYGYWYW